MWSTETNLDLSVGCYFEMLPTNVNAKWTNSIPQQVRWRQIWHYGTKRKPLICRSLSGEPLPLSIWLEAWSDLKVKHLSLILWTHGHEPLSCSRRSSPDQSKCPCSSVQFASIHISLPLPLLLWSDKPKLTVDFMSAAYCSLLGPRTIYSEVKMPSEHHQSHFTCFYLTLRGG